MPLVCLAKISPMDIATGSRVDLYVSAAMDRRVTGLGGVVWEPAMTAAPTLSVNLWQGDFREPVDTGGASFGLNMGVLKKTYANSDTLMWAGAPVEIYAEEPGTAWPWTARFKGRVASYSRRNDVLSVNASIETEPFDKDVLTATYAGTTGAEGPSDLKGRLKPLVIGWAQNVEPILINAVDNVYQFSAYGAIEAVSVLYERAASFGASIGDYASYAALVAATIPAGRWATCLATGMVRLGAPAAGVITGDIKGHKVGGSTPRLSGAVINALATIAGVSSSNIETATLSALDAAAPYPINLVLTDQVKWRDMAARIALACNWQSGITLPGKFFVLAVSLSGSEVITLNAQGRALPQVVSSEELDVSLPYYQTIFGANRNWRVQSADEIAFTADLVPLGRYNGDTTYREGNIVDLADGSTWLYTNVTPTSGNAPPTWPDASNSYWANLTPPTTAADIKYEDGTPIEDLKPAEPGATEGAPAGTDVAGRPAETVNAMTDLNAIDIIEQALRQDDAQTVLDARTFVEGQPVNAVFVTFRNEQIDTNAVVNSVLTLLGAKTEDGTAWVLDTSTVRIDPDTTMAQQFTEIGATNDAVTAAVTDLQEVVLGPDGEEARSLVKARVADNIATLVVGATGEESVIAMQADNTVIMSADGSTVLAAFGEDADGAYIPDLKVDRLKIGTQYSGEAPFTSASTTIYGTGAGTEITVLSLAIDMPVAGAIQVDAIAALVYDSGAQPWQLHLDIAGVRVFSLGATSTEVGVALGGSHYVSAPGIYTANLVFAAHSSVSVRGRNIRAKVNY